MCNQAECVAALVELGCDTAIRDKIGRTGKQLAGQRDHAAVLDVLRAAVMARLRTGVAVDQPAATRAARWRELPKPRQQTPHCCSRRRAALPAAARTTAPSFPPAPPASPWSVAPATRKALNLKEATNTQDCAQEPR